MKIDTIIDICRDRYEVIISTREFTANECQLMAQFGEPVIDIGGTITGSLGRPGQTNTTVTITGGGGSGATAAPIIDYTNGSITGFIVTAPGSGYTSVPTVVITGDGTGATATAVLTSQTLTSITLGTAGTGYHVYPIPINLVYPSALRRIRTDSPFKRVFDLNDDPNSDVEAQFYATTIVSRLTAAKATLLTQSTFFTGETLVTV